MNSLQLLVDGVVFSPEPHGSHQILMAGERVIWMGDDLPPLPADLGVEVVELGGRRVIPGLVDSHVHVTGGGGKGGFANRMPALAAAELLSAGTSAVVGRKSDV